MESKSFTIVSIAGFGSLGLMTSVLVCTYYHINADFFFSLTSQSHNEK